MWYVDLVIAPLVAVSVGISATALVAKCRYRWHRPEQSLFTKISFTVFVVSALCVIGLVEWYLYHRFSDALHLLL